MSITKEDIEKIKKRNRMMSKFESVNKGSKIYIRIERFSCEKCSAQSIERSTQNGMNEKVKFYCKRCGHTSNFVYDRKQGISVNFKEYSEIMDKVLDKKFDRKNNRFKR